MTLPRCYRRKVPANHGHDALVLGRRYTGPEALSAGIVHSICPQQQLIQNAIKTAKQLSGIPRHNLTSMKQSMYADLLKILDDGIKNMTQAKL